MVYIKNPDEIRIIREGGRILSRILQEMIAEVKPGVSTLDLENILVKGITEAGGRPAFKNYNMGNGIYFPSALCASINNEVVHGSAIPGINWGQAPFPQAPFPNSHHFQTIGYNGAYN